MKKRLITVLLAVAMAVACVVGLVACEGSVDGKYVIYTGSQQGKQVAQVGTVELKDGQATISGGLTTTKFEYEVEDGNIVVASGTYKGTYKEKDNYYYMAQGDMIVILCEEGETPKGYSVTSLGN